MTTCKCQEPHAPRQQPGRRVHVRNTYGYERTERKQCCILVRIRVNPHRAVSMLDDVLALCSRQLYVLACDVALRSARTCFAALCRADCFAVFPVDDRQHARIYEKIRAYKTAQKTKKNGKRRILLRKGMKQEKGSPASLIRRRC